MSSWPRLWQTVMILLISCTRWIRQGTRLRPSFRMNTSVTRASKKSSISKTKFSTSVRLKLKILTSSWMSSWIYQPLLKHRRWVLKRPLSWLKHNWTIGSRAWTRWLQMRRRQENSGYNVTRTNSRTIKIRTLGYWKHALSSKTKSFNLKTLR